MLYFPSFLYFINDVFQVIMTTSNTIVRNIGLLQGITNCLQDWTDSLDQGTNGTNTVKDLLASLSRGLTSLKDDVAKLNQVENQNPLPQMNSIIQSTVPVIGSTPHMINSTHFGQTRESRFPQKSSNVIKRVSGAVIAPLTSVSTRKTPTKEVVEKGGSTTSNEEDDEIPVDEVKLKTTTKNEKVTKRSSEEPGPSGGRSLRKKHRVSYVDYVPFSDDSVSF